VLAKSNSPVTFQNDRKNLAAVILILTVKDDQLQVLFTHRTDSVSTHKDQVSLPGGLMESEDKFIFRAALRETKEEIGIDLKNEAIIGHLPFVESITNFQIHPFIGFIEKIGELVVNKAEVKNVFFVPLDWILNRNNWDYKKLVISGKEERNVIYFHPFGQEIIWGITAQILVNFSNLLLW
jgi:8-oxo-dGTP pyrophosphatase MutT (NUDIX family)